MLPFLLFFGAIAALLALLNLHVARWLEQAWNLTPRARRVLRVTLFGSMLALLLARLGAWLTAAVPLTFLISLGSVIQLSVVIACVLLLPYDLARLSQRLYQQLKRSKPTSESTPSAQLASAQLAASTESSEPLSRRGFLGRAAATSSLLVASSTSLYGALAGRVDYQIEEWPVRLRRLPRSLDGFTIVQLSDIHVGSFVGDAELAAAHDLVAKSKPDLIVLTGDLIDNDARYAEQLGRFARKLTPLAREGVVAISGNHDFYAGIDATVNALRQGGAQVLRNQGLVIGDASAGFALLGVDDVMGPRFNGPGPNLSLALRSLPKAARDLPRVLLCHNPAYFELSAGQIDLQLSGHTHGGQVNLGITPARWLLKNGWVAGAYEHKDSLLYVNRGFGTVGPPVRIGAPPEVTRIVLLA